MVSPRSTPTQGRRSGLATLAAALAFCTFSACAPEGPLRVGVMLPLSGADDVGWREPLELALDNVNRAGGPAGRRLELVWQDTAQAGVTAAARALLADDDVAAVVGPDSSADLMAVAREFLGARRPLVSPSATSGEVFRAFSGKSYVWRTVQSDVAQAKALVLLAKRGGASKLALLTSTDAYGTTFFDWVGFFATELGLTVTSLVRFTGPGDCGPSVREALGAAPDALLVVPSQQDDAVCIAQSARALAPSTRLLFSDGGDFPAFIDRLGSLAEGVEGTAPAADPASGFEIAYSVLLGHAPPPYAANAYDALTLLAFGLERSHGAGGAALAMALQEVVDGRGAPVQWDRQGVAETLAALRRGELRDLHGASGPLDFDAHDYTDPLSTTYLRWRVDHGRSVPVESLSTGEAGRSASLDDSFASERLLQDLGAAGAYTPGPRTGAFALIVALSTGWQNYRHQADALAEYQLLRKNGLPDSRIVLVVADDLATDARNAEPGVVRNVAGGPDLRGGAQVDYRIGDLGGGELLAILRGERSERLPVVLDSGPGDDVYAFFVGHGSSEGMLVGSASAVAGVTTDETVITAEQLASAAQAMFDRRRYRRLLIAVETCHGGLVGTRLTAPGTLLIAGANPVESSFGANYDPSLGAWLADQFAFQLVETARSSPDLTLDALYRRLFLRVSGSHVSLYNNAGFGGAGTARLGDFLMP